MKQERGISLLKVIGCCFIAILIWCSVVFIWSTWFVKKTTETVVDAGKEIVDTVQEEAEKGMTYNQVVNIIGAEGTFSNETQIGGRNYKYYTWNGVGFRS